MLKHKEEDLLRTLVSAFRDANLGMSRHRGIPFVQGETAQSRLFRIMDFWNTEMWDDTSTNAISKEVIFTLLQCAARLHEDKTHAKAAVDLIESGHTRAILSLGIQEVLCRVIHQRYIESMRSKELAERKAEDYPQEADLFSAIRKNKLRQLNYQAMIFEHVSSLCRSHGAALQNTFEIPRIDEGFMFHNYMTLSKAFNRYEKSWLVTLLPDIFKWEGEDSDSGTNRDELLAPNCSATKEANQGSSNASKGMSQSQAAITRNIIGGVNMSCDRPVSLESVESLHWSLPWGPWELSPSITDKAVQLSLGQASTKEWNELWGFCGDSGIGSSGADFESIAMKNKVLEFEKWMDLLRKSATNYPRWTSVTTITPPKASHNQAMSQREERRPMGIKIERKDASDYCREWKDRLLSLSGDIPVDDWNLLANDDSENIFPFSPDIHNNSANSKLLSTLQKDADNEHLANMSSAKDAQPAFTSVSPPSPKSTNKVSQRRSDVLGPGEWMRGRQNKTRLPTIPEELWIEVEDK